jgi:peptidyl-dipeptidase Dcp
MKRRSSISIALILALSGSSRLAGQAATPPPAPAPIPFSESNPFAKASALPYQAPPFDRIKESDYAPALEEGMKRQIAEIAAIADNPEPPTVANTLEAMERSGELLTRAGKVFFNITQSNTSDGLRRSRPRRRRSSPRTRTHYLNAKLYARQGSTTGATRSGSIPRAGISSSATI